MRAFADEPLRGVGAGGWSVYWLRYRTVDEFAQDAHSLPLQTLAEYDEMVQKENKLPTVSSRPTESVVRTISEMPR